MTATILRHTLLFLLLASLFVAAGCSAEDSTTAANIDGGEVTPLHRVAKRGDAEVLVDLIKAGADISARSKGGYTPLHFAATNGHVSVIETLLRYGADVNARDKNHYTPLHLASAMCHMPAINALIKNGANVNAGSANAFTPLHVSAGLGYEAATNKLIDAGANVNTEASGRFTPLHMAAQNGNLYMVDTLINAGADVNARIERTGDWLDYFIYFMSEFQFSDKGIQFLNKGATPARMAEYRGHKIVVSAIKEAGGLGASGASRPNISDKEALEKARAHKPKIGKTILIPVGVAVTKPKVGQTVTFPETIPDDFFDVTVTTTKEYRVPKEYHMNQLKFFKLLNFPFNVPPNEYFKSLNQRGCQ